MAEKRRKLKVESRKSTFFFLFEQFREDGKEGDYSKDDPTCRIDEVGGLDEHECCRSDESDDCKPQHSECLFEIRISLKTLAEPGIGSANTEHDDEARQNDGCSSENTSPYSGSGITHIRSAVDANRSGSDLANSNDIHEFLL